MDAISFKADLIHIGSLHILHVFNSFNVNNEHCARSAHIFCSFFFFSDSWCPLIYSRTRCHYMTYSIVYTCVSVIFMAVSVSVDIVFIHVRSSSWRCWAVLRFGWCQKPSSFVNMPSILFLLCVRALLRIWFISAAMQKSHAHIRIYIRMPIHMPWRIYWYIHKSLSIEYMYRV